MAKRPLTTFAVTAADWMRYRPYKSFDPAYDGYYLRFTNRVFQELQSSQHIFSRIIERKTLINLSVVLTHWLEDYANEVGIWAAFARVNKARYGYPLPFLRLHDYHSEEINVQDIAYVCWHFLYINTKKFISPVNNGLLEISVSLANMFEEILDDAPGTDYYDSWLQVDDNIPFFSLKEKLNWMAFNNFLLGPELQSELANDMEDLKDQPQGMGQKNQLAYAIQSDYLHQKRTSYGAMGVAEWFAEIARCSDDMRAHIRKLSTRLMGEFIFEGSDDDWFYIRQVSTKREFRVSVASIDTTGIKPGTLIFTVLVDWKGEWWVSGVLTEMGIVPTEEELVSKAQPPSFYTYEEHEQQTLRESVKKMEADFLQFYGDRMVFFRHRQHAETAMQQTLFHLPGHTLAAGSPPVTAIHDPLELPQGQGVALFFRSGEGLILSNHLAKLAWLLAQPELDTATSQQLFGSFFTACSSEEAEYLLQRFSARNLNWPLHVALPLADFIDYLLRMYNPASFIEKVPATIFK